MAAITPEPIHSRQTAAAFPAYTAVSLNGSSQWAIAAPGSVPDGFLDRKSVGPGDQTRALCGPYGAELKANAGGAIPAGSNLAIGPGGTLVVAAAGNAIIGKSSYTQVQGDVFLFLFGYRGQQT